MAREDIQIIRHAYDAWNRGDVEAAKQVRDASSREAVRPA
jgi:ketosteroid isomerase-like protein